MKFYFIEHDGHYRGASAEREECPPSATAVIPDCEFPWWNGTGWETDIVMKERIEAVNAKSAAKLAAIAAALPSRAQVKSAIDAAFPDAKQNAVITKMANVVYWLAKDQAK